MHPYYEQRAPKLKKNMANFLKYIKPELEAELHMPYDNIFNEIWEVYYTKYMENFPYIGGDKIAGTSNLTGAYCYIAMGDVLRRYCVSLERWGELTTICYKRFFFHFPAFLRRLVGKMLTNRRIATKMYKGKDRKNAANAKLYPESFTTEYQEHSNNGMIEFHNLTCPLEAFARKMNCTEYMPYICNLDYVAAEAFNIHFERTMTCASGDAYCNFCYSASGKVNPSWPCHSADANDPLK